MTFREQVGLARRWGVALIALAAAIVSLASFFGHTGPEPFWVQGLFLAFALPGLVLLVFGGLMRPLQRTLWFRVARPSSLTGYGALIQRSPLAPLWRWWLHVDTEGKDRDL